MSTGPMRVGRPSEGVSRAGADPGVQRLVADGRGVVLLFQWSHQRWFLWGGTT